MGASTRVTRPRSGGIDAVRVLGLLAVIAGHVWLHNDVLRAVIFPWHVPVFFFLTGYLWHSNRSLPQEVRKRFVSLGIPYVVWLLGIAFVYSVVQHVTADTSWRELGQVLTGDVGYRPFQTFWFVGALLVVALLYRLVSHVPWWGQALLAGMALGVGTLFGDQLSDTPWSLGAGLYCVAFTIMGALARLALPYLRQPVVTGVLLLLLGALMTGLGVMPVDLSPGDLGTPLLSGLQGTVISFGLVLVAEWLFDRLPVWCSTAASALAAPALVVLLLHPLLLWLLHTPDTGSVWQFVVIVVISWSAGLLIARTPLSPLLTGSPSIQN